MDKKYVPLLIPLIVLALILLNQFGPFLAYGVPSITIQRVKQVSPVTKIVNIGNSYGSWIYYRYEETAGYYRRHPDNWWGRELELKMTVELTCKVEVSDIASPRFLTEIKPSPFLIAETDDALTFRNITISAYAYSFKLNVAWSGSVQVEVVKKNEWGALGIPTWVESFEQMAQIILRDALIPDFNNYVYLAGDIILSVDAPTLGSDVRYMLNPDYVGILGMWLQDYRVKSYVAGTAVEAQPQVTGTQVPLYLDIDLTEKCWSVPTPADEKLIPPNVTYWFDHVAPQGAYFRIRLIRLGSTLVLDTSKEFPTYVSWAYEKAGAETPPALAQWFRIDLGFRTHEDFTVPNTPEYQIPPEEKEKQRIIITVEPENKGTPSTPPQVQTYLINLQEIMTLIYVIIAAVTAIIITWIIATKKWGR